MILRLLKGQDAPNINPNAFFAGNQCMTGSTATRIIRTVGRLHAWIAQRITKLNLLATEDSRSSVARHLPFGAS